MTVPHLRGLRNLEPVGDSTLTVRAREELLEVMVNSTTGEAGLRFELELADAVGYWHPGMRTGRTLVPDWMPPTLTSLVHSAPVGALYNAEGVVLGGWAASEVVAELSVAFGVSEESKGFKVEIRTPRPLGELSVRIDTSGDRLATTAQRLVTWISEQCPGSAITPPPVARAPVFSTWYAFNQDLDGHEVLNEAIRSADLGCGSVFIDDGWQRLGHGRGYRGCGDWVPDTAKFADLAATTAALHRTGLAVGLWVAPLLLGPDSDNHQSLSVFAPYVADNLRCQVLDPRHPEVRQFVTDTCLRLVQDYRVDLLKIDFLDVAMSYGNSPTGGDVQDVGEAMCVMLHQVREAMRRHGRPDVAFEFRQPYVSPAIARFGEILRANDCPADSVVNRTTVVDARLVSVGQVVHADPLMWGPTAPAEAVAQQLYGAWFSVPQVSMRLSRLTAAQTNTLRGLLRLWRHEAAVILDGELQVWGAERNFDMIRATRRDLGRSVTVAHAPLVVDIDEGTASHLIINSTSSRRLAVRTTRPILSGEVMSVAGDPVDVIESTPSGIHDLPVPPFGSVRISTSAAPTHWPSGA